MYPMKVCEVKKTISKHKFVNGIVTRVKCWLWTQTFVCFCLVLEKDLARPKWCVGECFEKTWLFVAHHTNFMGSPISL